MSTMSVRTIFTPDYARYEGVRPINIYLLRLIFFLMLVFVGSDSWRAIVTHQGAWDHVRAVAICAWASYSTLSFLGLIHPLRMLPIMLFVIAYKVLWLIVVAYPLWRANALAGSPAEEMTYVFLWVPLPIIAVPWKYVFETYVMWSKKTSASAGQPQPRRTLTWS
jgi:hypothetical protein